jgi:F0F1-type ATP synthase assembly protein I
MMIGLGLGFVTGVVNVMRAAQLYSKAQARDVNAPPTSGDEE